MKFDRMGLYLGNDYTIGNGISIKHPTIKDILDYGSEEKYLNMVHRLTATPSDLKVFLYDTMRIFHDAVDDFTVFSMIAPSFPQIETEILFGDLDLSEFELYYNENINNYILKNTDGVVIDKAVAAILTEYLRAMHFIERNDERGHNEFTKLALIEVARQDMAIASNKPFESQFAQCIPFLVSSGVPMTEIINMPVYVFYDVIHQIMHNKEVDRLYNGIYAGTIDYKKLKNKQKVLSYFRQ